MIKRILVAVDFSEGSKVALRHAVVAARQTCAELELVHVIPDTFIGHNTVGASELVGVGDLHGQLVDSALKQLGLWSTDLEKSSGLKVSTHLASGETASSIANYAKSTKVEMIVAATHGRTGFDHFLMGSVCERMVRRSPCPVLVARPQKGRDEPQFQSLAVAVDTSECSLRALELAANMALAFHASLKIVHVWEQPYFARGVKPNTGLLERLKANVKAELDRFVRSAALPVSLNSEPVMLAGSPAVTLVGWLQEALPDLVVLGTHGRTAFKHFLVGSVAETVTRYAPCTTLVVP